MISTRKELLNLLSKNRPKTLGFTSGAFDLLHAGHVDYLMKAREKCDFLIVAVNTDASIREYKSALRPIIDEDARLKVVAALRAVDYTFLFSETNNNQNIELLKPDIYFKAGDYSKEQLSSAKIVESYGGRVELVRVEEDYSTSEIINTVLEKYSAKIQNYIPKDLPQKQKALILDRDGTINVHKDYLFNPDEFELLAGAAKGIKSFQDAGYKIVVITNQPGIDFGYFKMEDLFKVNKKMLNLLSKEGVLVDKIYFSPYTKAAGTECRKPGLALIKRAEKELNLALKDCIVIGDSTGDIKMGQALGCKTILVTTGNAGKDALYDIQADFQVGSIQEGFEVAADY